MAKLDALQAGLGKAHDLTLAEAALASPKPRGSGGGAADRRPSGKDRKRELRRAGKGKRDWKEKCLRSGGQLFAYGAGKFRRRYLQAG